ncbi:hypothetical protein CC85DRAFT_289054, partial [Cutaneotrichosporon oleaginosum]
MFASTKRSAIDAYEREEVRLTRQTSKRPTPADASRLAPRASRPTSDARHSRCRPRTGRRLARTVSV